MGIMFDLPKAFDVISRHFIVLLGNSWESSRVDCQLDLSLFYFD